MEQGQNRASESRQNRFGESVMNQVGGWSERQDLNLPQPLVNAQGDSDKAPQPPTGTSPKPPRDSDNSRIYFALQGMHIKIGHSHAVERRIAVLQTATPEPIILLGTFPGGKAHERELHERFAHLRASGEWFRISAPLLSLAMGRDVTRLFPRTLRDGPITRAVIRARLLAAGGAL